MEILRVPFWEISTHSQLLRFQYNANDRNLTDKHVLMNQNDFVLCQSLSFAHSSSRFLVVVRNHTSSSFFYDPDTLTLHELCANGTINTSTVQPIAVASFSDPLPAIDLGSSLIYAGNLSSLSLISRKQHIRSLPVGTFSQVNEAIHHIPLTRRYRHFCYSLFQNIAKERPIRSNEMISETIPFLTPSLLFDEVDSFAARLWRKDADISYYSPFAQLVEMDLNTASKLYFARPLLRTITCHIDTSLFRTNHFYRRRMENTTVVDGVLLRLHDQEKEGNETIYEVSKEGVKELRYVIDVEDQEEEASFVVSLASREIEQMIQDRCGSKVGNDSTVEWKELSGRNETEEISDTSSSPVVSTGSEELGSSEVQQENSLNSSRRLSDDPLLHYITSYPENIVHIVF